MDQAQVELGGGFWGRHLEPAPKVTIPHNLDDLEKDGHVPNFDKRWEDLALFGAIRRVVWDPEANYFRGPDWAWSSY